jgi:hypothetical protein
MTPAIMAKVAKPAKLHQIIDLESGSYGQSLTSSGLTEEIAIGLSRSAILGSAKTQA